MLQVRPNSVAVNQDGDLKRGHGLAVFWDVFSSVVLGRSPGL